MKIQREAYLSKLRELRGSNLIKVLTGMRRVGKSTLMADFRDEIVIFRCSRGACLFY